MKFQGKWITTHVFEDLKPINIYHKERGVPRNLPTEIQNYHVHFRKRLQLPQAESVVIHISADDYCKLYVNGTFVSQGPGTAYEWRYRYNRVDITKYLVPGENVIAVHVFYQGLVGHAMVTADNRQGMIADIFVDGQYFCGTDETWLYQQAEEYSGEPLIGYKAQFQENIDFRKKDSEWKTLKGSEEGYRNAVVKEADEHCFQDEPAPCICVYPLKPEKVVHLDTGKWFLDFGTEVVGQFYMVAQGEEGQQVEICCGEETVENEPYTARHLMRCNCNYREVCTLSGGRDELEFFDYKAFRYVNVNTDRDNLDSETFCVMARHNPFEEKCELRSNVPWLEEIWKLCVNSLKWGTQEDFLDCPSREKGLYLGDFTVSGLAYLYVTGDAAIYKKTLLDFASTTKICPGMMAVASGSLMQEIADFSLQYPLQVLNYYYYTGDRTTVEELYPVICGIMDYFKAYEREDGLLEHVDEKWNLVDWPVGLRDGYTLPGKEHERRPLHNVLNAHYIGALLTVQKLQRILGLPTSDHVETCKRNFIKTFYDPQTKLFCDMPDKVHSALHSNVLPAFYGFAPEEAKPYIRECILRKGLCCGTQFSYFVLKALGKVGTKEDQIKLLLNEREHSWVNMLREGATTTFEAWGKEQKSNTSLCHPWSCAPVILIVEDILQKNPAELGRSEKTILQWNAQSERIV